MTIGSDSLIIIGENLNATRKIKGSNPTLVTDGARKGLPYTDISGKRRLLDLSDAFPRDPDEQVDAMIPYVAQCFRNRDFDYLTMAVHGQLRSGAHIIDLCVDEMSPYPEERMEWMEWLVRAVQEMTDAVVSIDSSDPATIEAGLRVHDRTKSRPFINSVTLEDGRHVLHAMAKEHNAYLAGNASGQAGMPYSAEERVQNLVELSKQMDAHGIPMEDRFLDALVFPVGAGSEYGAHYLDAVTQLRAMFPKVHLFGGHSNISFGLPNRKILNDAFVILSILAGCDTIMVDPLTNVPERYLEFKLAADAVTGKDNSCIRYIAQFRRTRAEATRASPSPPRENGSGMTASG